MPTDDSWLDAEQASQRLGVKRATLYAYASRGKIRSRTLVGSRKRLYARDDVERLHARSEARSGHRAVAAGALRWGEPVMDSQLTDIRPDGHRYRGLSARELAAEGIGLEALAELLWGRSTDPNQPISWPRTSWPLQASKLAALLSSDARPLDAMAIALPALAVVDPHRLYNSPTATVEVARRLVRLLIAAMGLPRGLARAKRSLAEPTCARAFLAAMDVRARPVAVRAVEQCLVLTADHELNPSSFAARLTASVDADLYACVNAALATLSGPLHGGMPERVQSLVEEAAAPELAARTIGERLRRGDPISGFGHTLYPNGDPRTAPLIDAAQRVAPQGRGVRIVVALCEAMRLAGGEQPSVDVGLVAMARALHLPPGGATALFACGRMVGWIAHVLEQREAGFLMRPRARYTGR
jgi:citrate synthase